MPVTGCRFCPGAGGGVQCGRCSGSLSDLWGDVALVVSGTRVKGVGWGGVGVMGVWAQDGVSWKCISEWPWNCVCGLFEDFNGVNFY